MAIDEDEAKQLWQELTSSFDRLRKLAAATDCDDMEITAQALDLSYSLVNLIKRLDVASLTVDVLESLALMIGCAEAHRMIDEL
jgi:hypothetical protein